MEVNWDFDMDLGAVADMDLGAMADMGEGVAGDGPVAEIDWDMGDFAAVDLSTAADVSAEEGDESVMMGIDWDIGVDDSNDDEGPSIAIDWGGDGEADAAETALDLETCLENVVGVVDEQSATVLEEKHDGNSLLSDGDVRTDTINELLLLQTFFQQVQCVS